MNNVIKFKSVNDSFCVYMYDNGYMLEISGRGANDDWKTSKTICSTIEEVVDLIKTVCSLPRDN